MKKIALSLALVVFFCMSSATTVFAVGDSHTSNHSVAVSAAYDLNHEDSLAIIKEQIYNQVRDTARGDSLVSSPRAYSIFMDGTADKKPTTIAVVVVMDELPQATGTSTETPKPRYIPCIGQNGHEFVSGSFYTHELEGDKCRAQRHRFNYCPLCDYLYEIGSPVDAGTHAPGTKYECPFGSA